MLERPTNKAWLINSWLIVDKEKQPSPLPARLYGDVPAGRGAEEAPLSKAVHAVRVGRGEGRGEPPLRGTPVEQRPRRQPRGARQLEHRRAQHMDRRREPARTRNASADTARWAVDEAGTCSLPHSRAPF